MNYSTVKSIYNQLENIGLDNDQIREFVSDFNRYDCDNFETSDYNYRIISDLMIDEIMIDELSNDEYILGCFNDWFIAENCNINLEVVEALQKAEAHEALGRLMLKNGIDELQSEYARLDGYGHHFAHYDGYDHEMWIDNKLFHVFKIG